MANRWRDSSCAVEEGLPACGTEEESRGFTSKWMTGEVLPCRAPLSLQGFPLGRKRSILGNSEDDCEMINAVNLKSVSRRWLFFRLRPKGSLVAQVDKQTFYNPYPAFQQSTLQSTLLLINRIKRSCKNVLLPLMILNTSIWCKPTACFPIPYPRNGFVVICCLSNLPLIS